MILANNITCRRGSTIVFRNLNFKVENSIATIISGKNGSGKTSLLRILANLLNNDTFNEFDIKCSDIDLNEKWLSFLDFRDFIYICCDAHD